MQKKVIGLIAGSGNLPLEVIKSCNEKNVPLCVVFINNIPDIYKSSDVNYIICGVEEVKKILDFFKANFVIEVIMAGHIQRPSFMKLRPDFRGMILLKEILKKGFLGDDALLKIVTEFVEKEGFKVIAPENILNNNLNLPLGFTVGDITKVNKVDIDYGIKALKDLGKLDIGQAVVVENGLILAVEAAEGTDALIERSKNLMKNPGSAVLVKCAKPNQEQRVDMPCIGFETVSKAYECGFAGVAIEANKVLVLEKEKVISAAEKFGIYIISI